MDFEERAREVIGMEAESLRQMASRIGTGFGEAVKLLRASLEDRGKVVIVGVGKSGNVGNPLFPASGPATGSFNGLYTESKFLAAANPLFPASGPATGSFNGLYTESKFLAALRR